MRGVPRHRKVRSAGLTASFGPLALPPLPTPHNGSVVSTQVDYALACAGQQPKAVKRPPCVADKTPANRPKRDRAMSGDASDKQPKRRPGGGSDPLAEMSARDVEEAITEAEGLAADAAEQVGAGEEQPETDQAPAQGSSGTNGPRGGSVPQSPPDSSAEGPAEADPVDEKLAQLEALLSGVRGDAQEPKPKPPAQGAKQPESPTAADQGEGTSGESVTGLSEQEANELDELIAGGVDAEAIEGAESGASTHSQDAQQSADRDAAASVADHVDDTDRDESDGHLDHSLLGCVDTARAVVAQAVCVTFEVIDRPFQRLNQQAKDIIGWVGLATLVVAAVVLVISFLID